MKVHFIFIITSLFLFGVHTAIYSQCPIGLTEGVSNLVTNGDFSGGNVSFTSGYDYCNTSGCLGIPGADGNYTVGATPGFYNSSFTGVDHTTGTGDFLIANGATTPNTAVWCQTIATDPLSYYVINFWVTSLVTQNPASLQLYINGFPLFGPITAPSSPNTWVQYNNTMQSGILQSIEFCLYDMHTDFEGNDFGIDDISIKKCECDLAVTAGPDKSMCYGDSVQLDGSGAAAYFWSPTNSLSCFTCANPVASPSTTTTYTVIVNGPGGCTVIDSTLVTVFQHFDLHAGPDTSICAGSSVQLHADGAVSYSWQPSATLSDPGVANPVASPSVNTTYYLNAVDEHGCSQSDSASVKIFPIPPNLEVTPNDTTICLGGSAVFHLNGAGNYVWNPLQDLKCLTCAGVIATPQSTITYTITSVDSNGCAAGSDTARVIIDLSCSHVDIPSAFSPNGDGKNDFFHAVGQGITSFDLKLFNRWGQLIFSATNPDSLWDGKLNGQPQPVGVYIWVLKAKLNDGTVIDRKGNVTLVR